MKIAQRTAQTSEIAEFSRLGPFTCEVRCEIGLVLFAPLRPYTYSTYHFRDEVSAFYVGGVVGS